MNKQQKRNIFIIEHLLLGAGPGEVTNWLTPHDRAIIRRFLGHVKELEQQRDAALRLAEGYMATQGEHAILMCVMGEELRDIFEPKK